MKKTLNIGVIGMGFMGKAHSNAWNQLPKFFDIPYDINLKVICDANPNGLDAFAAKWGYDEYMTDWKAMVAREDIDVVDIMTPTFLHEEMALEAIKNGKHVICEKPCALTAEGCEKMAALAEEKGVVTYLNHNYRRVPAVSLAKKMIEEGRLGTIYHYVGNYFQDWIMDPNFPATWQLKKELAGGGPLFDLSSHNLDLARFLVGEPKAVTAKLKTFITERPKPGANAGTFSKGEASDDVEMVPVEVDDSAFMIVEFENGAIGTIDSTRFACGRKNYNCFEVYGSKGALKFCFERMNEIEFYDNTLPDDEKGYRTILATEGTHPYVGHWWPSGHIIGYEHTFVHAFNDVVCAIANGTKVTPNFADGAKIIAALEAAQKSDAEGKRIEL